MHSRRKKSQNRESRRLKELLKKELVNILPEFGARRFLESPVFQGLRFSPSGSRRKS